MTEGDDPQSVQIAVVLPGAFRESCLMQVKIFTGCGIDTLENEINEWLKQNSAIEIRHVTHTSDNRVMMQDVVTNWVIVWYGA